MRKIKVAAMGVEHRHIFGQLNGMLNLGCECVGWWNETDNKITKDFNEKHADIPRFTNKEDLLKNKEKPIFASSFQIPSSKNINQKLILGSSMFGIGWGMIGLCPGPAISSIAFLQPLSILFIISMMSGFYFTKFIKI